MLLDQHAKLIEDSGISPEVRDARGYRSVERPAELEELGFASSQRRVPALLIPIRDTTGEIKTHLLRPDEPRISEKRQLKYEIPAGARMVIDVPPTVAADLGNPTRPLIVTEGARKADSAASRGLCCISLIGVWCWRGTNERGGKVALPDFESIALNDGREVYVAFDSDVTTKPAVNAALERLVLFLKHRGARVRVIYLPHGDGGAKVGLDDFLAAGHTVDDLLALVADWVPEADGKSTRYSESPDGIVWNKQVKSGTNGVPLTNFTARITADVLEDDGLDQERYFELSAELHGRTQTFTVPAAAFDVMKWTTERIGAAAIVYPGYGLRDEARCAIQVLSGDPPRRTRYAHLGWRRVEGKWLYLHAGGAIGAAGTVSDVESAVSGDLERFDLPEPPRGQQLVESVRASLELVELGPPTLTVPLLASVYRAPLGPSDFSTHLTGKSGQGKTALAAVMQQHWGSAFDERNLAESWQSTANAIEALLFGAKDALIVVDEFAPGGSAVAVDKAHRDADRVFRAQGNQAGRARMRADGTLKPSKHPRGVILSTGEDLPRGQSLRARVLVIEVEEGAIDFKKLSHAQHLGSQGLLACALAGYVSWLAPRYDELRKIWPEEFEHERSRAATESQHRRTPAVVANLRLGWRYLLAYARASGAVSSSEADQLEQIGRSAIGTAANAQARHQSGQEPVQRFLDLLRAAIANGSAHIAARDGSAPPYSGAWGWRDDGAFPPRPTGSKVGWLEGNNLYLEPEASFAAAQGVGRDVGDALAVSPETLRKRLHEAGLLLRTDLPTGRETIAVRVQVEGKRRQVLHLHSDTLLPHQHPTDPQDAPDQGRRVPESDRSGQGPLPSILPTASGRPAEGLAGHAGRGGRVVGGEGPDRPAARAQVYPEGDDGSAASTARSDDGPSDHPDQWVLASAAEESELDRLKDKFPEAR